MDFAKNFTLEDFFRRVVTTAVYLLLAGFSGTYSTLVTKPIYGLMFKYSPSTQGFFLSVTAIIAMLAITAVIACKAAFHDTEKLKYSIVRNIFAFFCSCIVVLVLFLVFGLLKMDEFLSSYLFFPYYIMEDVTGLMDFLTDGLFSIIFANKIVYTAAILILNFITLIIFYRVGRYIWIADKKRKINRRKKSVL